ncbi:A-kinase anchor protein 5 [Ctenodactylus gundi]
METTVSEIQVENKGEKRSVEASPQEARQKEGTPTLCFKRRKKTTKMAKPKTGSEATDLPTKCPPEASDQRQRPGGAWASIKRLVTRRKRSESSKQQQSLEAKVHPDLKAEDVDLSKKKAKSRLKIPCIKFPRRAQKSQHSKLIEDSSCSMKVQGEIAGFERQTQAQPEEQVPKAACAQDLHEGDSQKEGHEVSDMDVSHSTVSGGNVISVELELDKDSALHTGTLILEKEVETIEENKNTASQPASLLEHSETDTQQPGAPDGPPPPALPDQETMEGSGQDGLEGEPKWEESQSREVEGRENQLRDAAESSQESDLREEGIREEKPKSEEPRRMEPIAIIITDTEISEFDVKKSKNVPKPFLFSIENEQIVFANDSGFEGRTPEQYETLLIETASSLVKNAIQLSVEQLVNEMASDDNQTNALLQ